jgi:lipoprotein-anchoring transpeptidase ErfK/SrfK
MLARRWFSRRYYNSPMPYAIFFHRGYAIHGTYELSRLGGPASHGCVRLHPQNAAILFSLVREEGPRNTRIVVE